MAIAPHTPAPPDPDVRSAFQQALWEVEERTLTELRVVRDTLRWAAEAATTCDQRLAAEVTRRGAELERRYCDVHDRLLVLIARHAPVATDLRLAMALVHVNDRIDRMGAQCANIATMCRAVPPGSQMVPEQRNCLAEMARLADEQIGEAADVFATRDVDGTERLRAHDQAINERNRQCFALAVEHSGGDQDITAELLAVLMARAIERIGDNAVAIAHQAAFVATGDLSKHA
jgi:phosphate transport system protein